ncbi:MAG: hypothetical protein GW762_03030 [Candidatus Pacebacteria bacterium]|nr:hypothetical protein [bacterium]NCS97535.1 hypothetical protein [Candidatus Paceibacterota bacterium]PIR63993.1 MAG: hypothetical protein COU64_01690 [Candidatus Pacebacteria bacterium CG10_big_fil_rev_8_21_14_0_10_40_26]PIZ79080.1 MAG: hypothetical protein COY01_01475 [Candidatus Pacebacteria bacterium CG_4_10_14_0_2_um_filter_40_20]PJA69232.1 MAG: hypothetical protein CO156_01360 [Candidatus Pacebacteria bacterium CG_4_9_14_3_um_filter_40_12]PJC42046.1 MAG: hypothetical protein CO041_0018
MHFDPTTTHLLIAAEPLKEKATQFLLDQWQVDTNYPHIAWFGDEAALKIATVRNLQEYLSFASSPTDTRFCVVLGLESATLPAQNALLKLVEEPPVNTQIVLVGQSLEKILPTIQSRCLVTKQTEKWDTDAAKELYTKLSGSTIPVALQLAEEYTDRTAAIELANQLTTYFHTELEKNGENAQLQKHIAETLRLKKRLGQNGNVQLAVEEFFLQLI